MRVAHNESCSRNENCFSSTCLSQSCNSPSVFFIEVIMLVWWRLNCRLLLLSYWMLKYFEIPAYSKWIQCLDAILIISPKFMRLEGSSLFLDNIIDFATWLVLWLVSYRMVWLAPLKSLAICKHGNSLWTSNNISSVVWHWRVLVIIGSVNCLLPDGTMPSPGLMVTYCQLDKQTSAKLNKISIILLWK